MTTQPKHTPAPWILDTGEDEFCISAGVTICRGDDSANAWTANVRLIRAAPELLKALNNADKVFSALRHGDGLDLVEDAWEICRAAIAKATGSAAERDRLKEINAELLQALQFLVLTNKLTSVGEKKARAAIEKAMGDN